MTDTIRVLSFTTLALALGAYCDTDDDVLVDVAGEAWTVNGVRGTSRLVDWGPRDRGERCSNCGTKKPAGVSPNETAGRWTCSNACHIARVDHYLK